MKNDVVWKLLAKLQEGIQAEYEVIKDYPEDSAEYQKYLADYKVFVIQCNILLEVILGEKSKLLSSEKGEALSSDLK